jgi:hypothetical protein
MSGRIPKTKAARRTASAAFPVSAKIFTKLCFIEASLRLFAQPIRKIGWKPKADRGWRGLGSTFARAGRRKKHQHSFPSGWAGCCRLKGRRASRAWVRTYPAINPARDSRQALSVAREQGLDTSPL